MKKSSAVFHLDDSQLMEPAQRRLLALACRLRTSGYWNCVVCKENSPLDKAAEDAGFDRLHLPFVASWDMVSALFLRRQLRLLPVIMSHKGMSSPDSVIMHSNSITAAAVANMIKFKNKCFHIVNMDSPETARPCAAIRKADILLVPSALSPARTAALKPNPVALRQVADFFSPDAAKIEKGAETVEGIYASIR